MVESYLGQSSTEVGLRVERGWEHDLLVSACEASGGRVSGSVCEVIGHLDRALQATCLIPRLSGIH